MAKTKIDDLAVVLSASSDQLAGDLRAAAKLLDGFKKQIDKQDAGGSVMRQTSRELQAQKKAAHEATAAWRAVARAKEGSFRSAVVGGAVGGAVAVGGLVAVKAAVSATKSVFDGLKESVNLAAELEQTTIAFEVMTGSADKGAKTIASLRALAVETPFSQADVIGSAKQLLGFGFEPAQAVETIRMLGDVSAGTGKDLKELSYLYGTLAAQGRAYMTDINQFATAGVPIFDTLAKVLKVNKNEVRGLVEEGKVGANEVLAAFKLMTGPGGLYENLTARQADTMKGAREQLSDAFDMLKTRLGQVIIEQMGLKQGARDTEAFVKKIEEGIPRIERFVRFVGDLGRSVATVAGQLLQAAAEAARFSEQLVGDTFPELRKGLQEFADWVREGKEFRIRPEMVLEGIIAAGDTMMRFFQEFLRGLRSIGESLRDDILLPIQRTFRSILATWAEAKDLVGKAEAAELYPPPMSFETDFKVVQRGQKLWNDLVKREKEFKFRLGPVDEEEANLDLLTPAGKEALRKRNEARDAHRAFMNAIGPESERMAINHEIVVLGKVRPNADFRGPDVALGDKGGLQRRINDIESGRFRWNALGERGMADLALKRAAEDAANSVAALGGGAMFAAKQLTAIDQERAGFAAGFGGLGMVARDMRGQKVLPREELKPFDAGPAARVEAVRLPDAALRDTEAATRVINLNMAQQSGDRTPLNMIEKNTAATVSAIMALVRELNMPAVVELPK